MDDGGIISLFTERSEEAVRETRIKYGKLVFSMAMRVLRCEADAEECENDAYMAVWNLIPPEKPRNFKAFLLKITRNQALKKYEYLNAEKRSPQTTASLDELGECASDESAEIRYTDLELADTINRFLADIGEESRRVFMLRYWYFMPVRDICERCGISKSKAESMLFRTRKKLKKFLEEEGR
ncbi:MAG: sigma-70 family RNA polymerase sigma factor [Prevotella sp.]|nr:sigma-70 family RNA polymerase sigma factor [Prevotella sp.]